MVTDFGELSPKLVKVMVLVHMKCFALAET